MNVRLPATEVADLHKNVHPHFYVSEAWIYLKYTGKGNINDAAQLARNLGYYVNFVETRDEDGRIVARRV